MTNQPTSQHHNITLLCPENSSTSIELEMAHVIDWAREKNDCQLTKDGRTGLSEANISNDLLPSVMSDVRRVGAAKLLGVHLTHNLSFSQHIDAVVRVCNQRLYLLAQLKRQGLDLSALNF